MKKKQGSESRKKAAEAYLEQLVRDLADGFSDLEEGERTLLARKMGECLIAVSGWSSQERLVYRELRRIKERAIARGWGKDNAVRLAVQLEELQKEEGDWLTRISANVFSLDPVTEWECDVVDLALKEGFAEQVRRELDELGLAARDFE